MSDKLQFVVRKYRRAKACRTSNSKYLLLAGTISGAALNLNVADGPQNTITPARQTENMRKTSWPAGLLFVLVLNERIVREQILIDPILGIVRTRNISVNVGRIAAVRI